MPESSVNPEVTTGSEPAGDLAALERFVLESDDLLALEERIGRFNIFDALGIARRELQHSNFLAWLLDPAESHGQGDLFLRAVLMDMMRGAREQGIEPPVSPVLLDGDDLGGVEVRREWKNIDLLIACERPQLVIVIENKVDSSEHSGQLERYDHSSSAVLPLAPRLSVFLTPDGTSPSRAGWIAYSYRDLHRSLAGARRRAAATIGGEIGVFIDQYLRLIGERFVDNPEIDQLCRHIYTNHRRAIDLIVDRCGSDASEYVVALEQWFRERASEWIVLGTRSRFVYFLPKKWTSALDGASLALGAPSDWPLFCEVHVLPRKVAVRCVVGPWSDLAARHAAVQFLTKPGNEFKFKMARKEATDRWTRVYSKTVLKLSEDDPADADLVVRATAEALDAIKAELTRVAGALQSAGLM